MPAQFPTSPSVGTTYTFSGVTWIYRAGGYWDVVSSGNISAATVSDTVNTSTGYFDLPSGTTAQRPSNPPSGAIRYNSSILNVEYYDSAYQRWMIVDKMAGDSTGGGSYGSTAGTGGSGGGGNGTNSSSAAGAGTVNRGGGGGSPGYSGEPNLAGAAGGSGIVIIRIPSVYTATFSAGLTTSANTTAVIGSKIYLVTAGTGTVSFSLA